MISGQPVVAKKKNFFFGNSLLYIKWNILSHRASLYLAPRVRMRRANRTRTDGHLYFLDLKRDGLSGVASF